MGMRVWIMIGLLGLVGGCETHRESVGNLPPGVYQGHGPGGGCYACRMDDDGLDCTCAKIDGTTTEAHISSENINKCKGRRLANVNGTFVCADEI